MEMKFQAAPLSSFFNAGLTILAAYQPSFPIIAFIFNHDFVSFWVFEKRDH